MSYGKCCILGLWESSFTSFLGGVGLGRVGNTQYTFTMFIVFSFKIQFSWTSHFMNTSHCLKASVNFVCVFFQLSKQFLRTGLILTGRKAKYVSRRFTDLSPEKWKWREKKIEKKGARRRREKKGGESGGGVRESENEGILEPWSTDCGRADPEQPQRGAAGGHWSPELPIRA